MYALYTLDGRGIYMEEALINWVYMSVTGQLVKDAMVPGVENAYNAGSLCDKCYNEMHELLLKRNGQFLS